MTITLKFDQMFSKEIKSKFESKINMQCSDEYLEYCFIGKFNSLEQYAETIMEEGESLAFVTRDLKLIGYLLIDGHLFLPASE